MDLSDYAGEQVEITLKMPFKGRKKYRGELEAREGGWRLLLADAGRAESDATALDFSLPEVREARLVPVIDFKGRRFAAQSPAKSGTASIGAGLSGSEVDGGRVR